MHRGFEEDRGLLFDVSAFSPGGEWERRHFSGYAISSKEVELLMPFLWPEHKR